MAIGSVGVDVKNSVGEARDRERVASSVGGNPLYQGRFRVPGAFAAAVTTMT